MSNLLLSFNAKSVDSEVLEKTLIGRKEIIDKIEKELLAKLKNNQSYQSLIVAPRGSGKTHLIKVLFNRLKANDGINNKIIISYMVEDEVGITNFLDFIVRILESFIRYSEPGNENLKDAIFEISNMPDRQESALKNLLLNYLGGKKLIILLENVNTIFEGMGETGQARLRDFMHEHNNICLIATSQNLFAHIQESKYPFYNFFKTVHLQKLDFKESFELMQAIADAEGNQLLAQELTKPNLRGKIRAIYELTGGNHRLLVEFYSFLKADIKSELSQVFVKTMNSLKPYYEQFVTSLPVQQQKIVKYISLQHKPQKGREIARSCFMQPNIATKQLSELFKKGYIDKHKEGKDVYYELKEPLMRICFEIGESPNGIAKLFVDFLSVIYGSSELKSKYLKYKYAARLQPQEIKEKYELEALMMSKAIDPGTLKRYRNLPDLERCKTLEEIEHFIEVFNKKQFKQEYGITREQFIQHIQDWLLLDEEQRCNYIESLPDLDIHQIKNLKELCLNEKEILDKKLLSINLYQEIINSLKEGEGLDLTDINTLKELSNKEKFKNDESILSLLGSAYIESESYKEAVRVYKKVVELNSEESDAYFNLGYAFFELQQYDEAISTIKKGLRINSEDEDAYNNMGLSLSLLKQYDEAISAYKKAIRINPNFEYAYYNMGIALDELKHFEEAILAYKKAIEINPEDSIAYNNIGYVFDEMEQYQEAISAYKKAIRINPNFEYAYYNMGIAFEELKLYQEAISAYQKVTEINPKHEFAYTNIGDVLGELQQYEEAISAYKEAIENNPGNADAYNNMGIAFGKLHQYEEAISTFKKAIELNPEYAGAYNNMGIALDELKQYEEAISVYKKAIELNQEYAGTYNNLGVTLGKLHQYEEAISSFKKAIELNPGNAGTYNNIGIALDELKQYQEAISAYKKAIEINPEYVDAYNNMGYAYIKLKKLKEAQEVFKQGLAINSEDVNLNFNILHIHIISNDFNAGQTQLLVSIQKIQETDNLPKFIINDILYPLFRYGSSVFFNSFFPFVLETLKKENKLDILWDAFPNAIFEMLINIEEYDSERLEWLEKELVSILSIEEKMRVSLLILNVGIRYLKKKEHLALYDLSKEERKVFNEFVLDKRKE